MAHTFESILEEVSRLQYSDDSMLDLILLIGKAIQVGESKDFDRDNPCYNNLIQTKEKELDSMMEKDVSDSDRKDRFEEALRNFKTDLDMFCIKKSWQNSKKGS